MKIRSLLIGMLASIALVGCTNDDESPLTNEESAVVKFEVNVEGALDSRAISDGSGTNTLMYGIFEDGVLIGAAGKKVVTVSPELSKYLPTEKGCNLSINLLRGRTYEIAFWAQNSKANCYKIDPDDMSVTVNYEGVNNDETRDAFFAVKKVEVTDNTTIEVILRRPFAQINVGAFKSDYQLAIETFGTTVDQSSALIKNVPNKLNLLDGSVEGEVNVEYSFGTIPQEDLKHVDVDGDEVMESYKWVSMSYILAAQHGEGQFSSHDMLFVFNQKNKDNSNIEFPVEAVPAKRNFRTNIVGQVLAPSANFNVKIDPIYDNEMIFSGSVDYTFEKNTTIKDTEFAFNNTSHYANFTSENTSIISFNNVVFSGKLYDVSFGEYKDQEYAEYINEITNVRAKNVVVGNCVHNESDHMSLLFYIRGTSTISNCEWIGTKKSEETMLCVTCHNKELKPVEQSMHNSIAYDCGVPNKCKATFESCNISSMYVWSQAQAIINGTAEKPSKIGYIRTAALKTSSINGYLSIGANTIVDELEVTPSTGYKRIVKILAGAHVKKLKLNGHSIDNVTIEEGAIVDEIIL